MSQSSLILYKQNLIFFRISDSDSILPQTLYQTLITDPKVFNNMSALPDLLPLLLDENRLRNQFVKSFLRRLAPDIVPRLVALKRDDIIVKALM